MNKNKKLISEKMFELLKLTEPCHGFEFVSIDYDEKLDQVTAACKDIESGEATTYYIDASGSEGISLVKRILYSVVGL